MSMQPHTTEVDSLVIAVAAASDDDTQIGVAPEAGVVTGVFFSPDAAITGINSNTRQYDLINAGQTGAGNTAAATIVMNAGVNGVKSDELVVPLSGTPANLNVAAGDVLLWKSTHIGTGLADPGGHVRVTFARTAAGA